MKDWLFSQFYYTDFIVIITNVNIFQNFTASILANISYVKQAKIAFQLILQFFQILANLHFCT